VCIGLGVPTLTMSQPEVQTSNDPGETMQLMEATNSTVVVSKTRSRPIPGLCCLSIRPKSLTRYAV
jgi:hypothetical protein